MSPALRAVICVVVFAFFGSPLAAGPSYAQAAEAPVILIIDMDKIRRDAVAVQSLQSEIDGRRSAYQSELQQREQELRTADQDLTRQRTILSAEAFTQKRKELEQRIANMQQEVRERRRAMESLFKKGMAQVQKRLEDIVREIAQDRQADLVLTKALVVLVKPEMEVTKQALDRLNAELPEVALEPAGD